MSEPVIVTFETVNEGDEVTHHLCPDSKIRIETKEFSPARLVLINDKGMRSSFYGPEFDAMEFKAVPKPVKVKR